MNRIYDIAYLEIKYVYIYYIIEKLRARNKKRKIRDNVTNKNTDKKGYHSCQNILLLSNQVLLIYLLLMILEYLTDEK